MKRDAYMDQAWQIWLLCMTLIVGQQIAASAQSMIRAKLGVQVLSGHQASLAKAYDRLQKDDKLRVYLIPEQPGHVYLIHSNQQTSTLLSQVAVARLAMTTFPSPQAFYEIDGESRVERLTVIYSLDKIEAIASLFQQTRIPYREWQALEKWLMQESKSDLGQILSKPFGIAGNVRSQDALNLADPGYQSHAVGERVLLAIQAESPAGEPLTFNASKLPPELSLNARTGTIAGVIAPEALRQSPYHVKISAANATVSGSTTFIWSITKDAWLQRLRMSSGKTWLVKPYEFTVKQ